MAWLAVDKDGTEKIFNVKPFKGNTQKDKNHVFGTYVGENYEKWYPKHNTDVLLVTLNKSDKYFSPSTMYKDYALSPLKFHWETQNKTSVVSETGKRYINNKSKVLLFVRDAKQDQNRETVPYTFLGPVECESYRGSRPIEIVWKMKYRIPARFIKELSRGLAI